MAKERFLVTDVTRMTTTTVCVAGFVRDDQGVLRSVRPVFGDGLIEENWLHHLPRVIRPFSVIQIPFGTSTPDPPHIEDRVMYPDDIDHIGEIGPVRRLEILEETSFDSVSSLYDGRHIKASDGGWFVPAGTDVRSIGSILAFEPRVYFDFEDRDRPRWRYTLQFRDGSGEEFRLAISDLAARRMLQSSHRESGKTTDRASLEMGDKLRAADDLFLRIGLARRRFDRHPERCYLQVTAIHSFPDYLEGKCHADFPREFA